MYIQTGPSRGGAPCYTLVFFLSILLASSSPARPRDFILLTGNNAAVTLAVLSPSGHVRAKVPFPKGKNKIQNEQTAISADGKYAFTAGSGFGGNRPQLFGITVTTLMDSELKVFPELFLPKCTGDYDPGFTINSIATGAVLPSGEHEVYIARTCNVFCEFDGKPGPSSPARRYRLEVLNPRYHPTARNWTGEPEVAFAKEVGCTRNDIPRFPAIRVLSGKLYAIYRTRDTSVDFDEIQTSWELLQLSNPDKVLAKSKGGLTEGCDSSLTIDSPTSFHGLCNFFENKITSLVSVKGDEVTRAPQPDNLTWVGSSPSDPSSKYIYTVGSETDGTSRYLFLDGNATVYRYEKNKPNKEPKRLFDVDRSLLSFSGNISPESLLLVPRQCHVKNEDH